MRRAAATLVFLALLAAGCGARTSKPYTADASIGCLKDKGFTVTTDPGEVGFIAAFAENGGLQARSQSGNVVTIAFTKDASLVDDTVKAFRAHASPRLRPHFNDVLRTQGNAVMVWTVTPTSDDQARVQGCLKS